MSTERATTCTHPTVHRDVYRNNGRLFRACRACDADVDYSDDSGATWVNIGRGSDDA